MSRQAATLPPVGAIAPDFTLSSTAGEEVTLSAFRGESAVLLAFFPLAFTSVCTAELCGFTEDHRRFGELDTTVLGISVDSIPTLQEFRKKHAIEIDLLSDFKREVSRAYGTLLEDAFLSSRAYIIIDLEGVIRWTFVEETLGDRRENEELLEQLQRLGQATPERDAVT